MTGEHDGVGAPADVSLRVVIATPLEPDLVARIRNAVPEADVRYDQRLLPPTRYPSDHRGVEGFARDAAGQEQWEAWLDEAEVLFGVPGETPPALRETVRRCAGLRWIQGTAAGAGEMLARARLTDDERARVRVTSAVGVHAQQLAEWAIFGLLALTKGLPRLLADKQRRHWDHYPVRELAGQHLVIVGLGQIGRQTARYARALGMRVTGVRRSSGSDHDSDVDEIRTVDDLAEVFPAADAVVLALPSTAETKGVIDRRLLEKLPRHAIVVNVGRGSVLDETALVAALTNRQLAGAALDVFAAEPLPATSPLWQLPNVIVSPHTAALSTRENERIVELFIDNLHRFLSGEPLRNEVDPRLLY